MLTQPFSVLKCFKRSIILLEISQSKQNPNTNEFLLAPYLHITEQKDFQKESKYTLKITFRNFFFIQAAYAFCMSSF